MTASTAPATPTPTLGPSHVPNVTPTAADSESRAAEFASVSAGLFHTRGVRTDSSVECWGANEDGDGNVVGQATPPGGEFVSVGAGLVHTCGVRTDISVEYWGSKTDEDGDIVGQATPLGGWG